MSSRPMLFGKYCLLERISTGGMAEVFRAKPLNSPKATDRFLALKRILPHLAEDEQFVKMFVDEAKLCVHLRHPNIVHIYELGHFQSALYILMEFIQGRDLLALQKRLRQNRLVMSVAQACYIAMELAKGLDHAHKATDEYGSPLNIIHRDISPQNVLISYTGQVKLIDFGVAKAAGQSTKTRVGVLKGKFGYMSPEQIQSHGMDHRSDIFAVGTVLWEMLTNRRLFSGDNEFEVYQKIAEVRIDPPSAKNSQIPPEVDRIVMKALAANPDERYSWASELARDLGLFLTSIDPVYTPQHLSEWMMRFFSDEYSQERQKGHDFAQLRTVDDVRARLFATDEPQAAGSQEPAPNQLWDADAQPDQGEDAEEFGANHTVVQAGGFDLDEFIALDDSEIFDAQPISASPQRTQNPGGFGTQDLKKMNADQIVAMTPHAPATPHKATQLDQGGTNPGLKTDAQRIAEATRTRNIRAGFAVAAMMMCVVLMGALALTFAKSKSKKRATNSSPVVGALVITSQPADGVSVEIDGVKRATRTPLSVKNLEPGEHLIKVQHGKYKTFETKVNIEPGRFRPLDVTLKKK